MKNFYLRALILIVILVTIVSFRNSFRELAVLLNENDSRAQAACSVNSFTASPNPAGPSDQVTVSWDITSNCALPRLFVATQDSIGLPSVSGTYNLGTITADTILRLKSSGVLLSTVTVNLSSPPPPPPPPPSSGSGLLFHSTLDNLSSVTSPAVGTGSGAVVSTSPANDFTSGRTGNGIRLDSIAEYVRFQQTDGSTKNVELDRGTLDFWFQPTYDHDDGEKYRIFGMGTWGNPGAWGMGKHNTSNGNDLYIHKFDASGNLDAINTIDVSNYGWNANDWVNVRVTWDWKAAPGVQNVRIYFNGVEALVEGDNGQSATTGSWYTTTESSSEYIYVGNVRGGSTSGMFNNAVFDEVKIWDTVIPPTSTPPSNPVPSISTFSASPSSITSGNSSTLSWSTSNATSCTASGGWSGSKGTSGTESVSPTSNATYTITCSGPGGSVNRSTSVTVTSTNPAPTVNFSASPTTITLGGSATLTWTSTNATSCTASGGWSGTKAISGTESVSPTSNTTYTIACIGASGTPTTRSTSVNISAPSGGPITLPAQPQLLNFSYPQVTGRTWTVNAGDNLQTALNQAQRGDEIVLEAGATFTGNFTLPVKSGTPANGWIVIRSSQSSQLPSRGTRVSPAHAPLMPKVLTPNVQPALLTSTAGATSGWWITGVEVSVTPTYNAANIQYGLLRLGSSGSTQNTLSKVPYDIVLDRMYIHGLTNTPTSRCVELNSASTQISDSYLAECHVKGFDSQAILGWNGPGPFKIVNNMLMGDTENIMFGGSDPSIPNLIPSDIEIRGNYIYTPASWGAGMTQKPWTKKNLFELKSSKRVLLEGNILDGSWSDAQKGMGIVIRTTNQSGSCTWCQTSDVTIRYNLMRNMPGVFDIIGDQPGSPTGGPVTNLLIEHNIFENINIAPYNGGTTRFLQIGVNPRNLVVRNNTMTSFGVMNAFVGFINPTRPHITNFQFTDNIVAAGTYGIYEGGGQYGGGNQSGEINFTDGLVVGGTSSYSGNVAIGSGVASRYPTTQFVSNISTARATGKGANESAVLSATQYAESGGGTSVPPPPPPTTPSLSLTANPTSVISGSASTLSWTASNVSTCTASGGWTGTKALSGTQSVSPTATTTYTLACTGSNGNVSRSVTVGMTTTTPPPVGTPGLTLTLNPTSVQSGLSALLTWLGTNVSTCTASGGWSGTRPTSGSLTVSPTVSTTYTLLCAGSGSQTVSRSATLSVTTPPPTPKPVVTLTASPTNINLGQSSSLSWSSTNATSCTASGSWQGTKTTSGIETVSPQGNATYTIDCTGNGGTTSQSVTVNVTSTGPLPTVSLSARPSSVERGNSATLSWTSSNATSCTASGDWSGAKGTSGNTSVSPSSSATYTLTCSNGTGNASASANITVTTPTRTPPSNGGGGGGGGGSSPVCTQVITWAKSPLTGEVKQFSTPCDVPTGWIIINPASAPVTVPGTGPIRIQPIDRPLYIGIQHSQVVGLQDFLKAKGFFPATEASSGYFGPITMKAVQDYQRSKGIEPLGNVGPQTRAAITAEIAGGISLPGTVPTTPTTPVTGSFTRSLYRGLEGADVTYLQTLLKKLGYFPAAEPTTTYFGPFTENAVKAFQKANGIVSSGDPNSTGYGLAGVRTRAKILELAQ